MAKNHNKKVVLAKTTTDKNIFDNLCNNLSYHIRKACAENINFSHQLPILTKDRSRIVRNAAFLNKNITIDLLETDEFNKISKEVKKSIVINLGICDRSNFILKNSHVRNNVYLNQNASEEIIFYFIRAGNLKVRRALSFANLSTDSLKRMIFSQSSSITNMDDFVYYASMNKNADEEIIKMLFDYEVKKWSSYSLQRLQFFYNRNVRLLLSNKNTTKYMKNVAAMRAFIRAIL